MRYARHTKILELIKKYEIATQEELAEYLAKEGYKTTQATVSRDIRELGLIKVAGPSGKSCYADAPKIPQHVIDKYDKILKETIVSVRSTENLIVIKTLPACASAVSEVIDKVPDDQILGTIAGDNTILVVVDSKDHVDNIVKMINEVIM